MINCSLLNISQIIAVVRVTHITKTENLIRCDREDERGESYIPGDDEGQSMDVIKLLPVQQCPRLIQLDLFLRAQTYRVCDHEFKYENCFINAFVTHTSITTLLRSSEQKYLGVTDCS